MTEKDKDETFKEKNEVLDMTNGKKRKKIRVDSHLRKVPGKQKRVRVKAHSRTIEKQKAKPKKKKKKIVWKKLARW
ncbi:MAG: hypothetical protein JXC85_05710 [Candidatus Aenigmarchaeota archaeon]|nr:hypothetical protein [Candidatus Aenigmarchaeota archaeon]